MTVSSGKAASVPWPDKALAHGLPVQATNRTSLANSVCISSTKMLYSDKVNISSSRGLLRSPNKWIQNRGNSGNSVVKFQASIFPAVSRVQGPVLGEKMQELFTGFQVPDQFSGHFTTFLASNEDVFSQCSHWRTEIQRLIRTSNCQDPI